MFYCTYQKRSVDGFGGFKIGTNEPIGVMRGTMAISGEMYTQNDISCDC